MIKDKKTPRKLLSNFPSRYLGCVSQYILSISHHIFIYSLDFLGCHIYSFCLEVFSVTRPQVAQVAKLLPSYLIR